MNNATKNKKAHIYNYELNLTFRRQATVTIETAATIEPCLAATIETWPVKYVTLTIETENSFKTLTPLP